MGTNVVKDEVHMDDGVTFIIVIDTKPNEAIPQIGDRVSWAGVKYKVSGISIKGNTVSVGVTKAVRQFGDQHTFVSDQLYKLLNLYEIL